MILYQRQGEICAGFFFGIVLYEKNNVWAPIWRLLYRRTAVQLTVIERVVIYVPSPLLCVTQPVYVFGISSRNNSMSGVHRL